MTPLDFRAEVRGWLDANCPASMRQPISGPQDLVFGGSRAVFPNEDARIWLERMAARGWTAPTWPEEFGGAGLSDGDARIVAEEMKNLGCRPPLVSIHGLGMLGPVLLAFGDDRQRARFLGPTAAGRVRWCQGFSEPAAGSDLASVRTSARRDGDVYVVNGQKVWTSYADEADWMFALVRTDPVAPKREGLGFLLVDLASPGVAVRPITLIGGESEFCEVFFDDVRVPVENLVAQEGEGWRITRFVLSKERQMLGQGTGLSTRRVATPDFVALAREALGASSGPLPDPTLRNAVAAADIDLACSRAAMRLSRRGRGDLMHPSVVKFTLSELMRRQADLASRVAGASSLGWAGPAYTDAELEQTRDYLYSKAWTIGGGSSEIQLNIIARQVLGLPHLGPEQEDR